MKGVELTERLIADIERSLETRNSVPDIDTQIKKATSKDLSDFVGALNAISFDSTLSIVIDLINGNAPIINFYKDNIPLVLEKIIESKEQIAQRFQEILDNESLRSLDDLQPVRKILVEKLDDLHGYSGRFLI